MVRSPFRALVGAAVGVAAAADAAPLPFFDGFERPPGDLSVWTSTQISAGATLSPSDDVGWSGTKSLKVAVGTASGPAAATVQFDTPATDLYLRFFIFLPSGLKAAMTDATVLPLVRVDEGRGAARVTL